MGGYFVRSVGNNVKADLIKHYIKYNLDEVHDMQLKLF